MVRTPLVRGRAFVPTGNKSARVKAAASMLRSALPADAAAICAMGGIALPNPSSIALHEKMGFRQVAHFREVGWKFDRRIDVGDGQLLLTPAAAGVPP